MTIDKTGEIQISHNENDVESKEVAAEKDASVKDFEIDKEEEQEKDVSEAMIPSDDMKIEGKKDFLIF